MNEATLQTAVTHAMKDLCRNHNKKMRLHVSASNEQRPAYDDSRPYDVGVLLEGAYLVGLEFKLQVEGKFPSWNDEQHGTYLGLTGSANIGLPLFYAYNTEAMDVLLDHSESHRSAEVLEAANVATPLELPGKTPAMATHEDMLQWLSNWLSDPSTVGRNGWTSVRFENSTLLREMTTAFPDLIWLLAIVHKGAKICWALTSNEVANHIESLRDIWQGERLHQLDKSADIGGAYTIAVGKIVEYLDAVQQDVANQEANATEMDDKPKRGGPKI